MRRAHANLDDKNVTCKAPRAPPETRPEHLELLHHRFRVQRKSPPSEAALIAHRVACERGELMYRDPESGLYVMTSVHLAQRPRCCGSGCRHCPFTPEEQRLAGRPDVHAWPWKRPK